MGKKVFFTIAAVAILLAGFLVYIGHEAKKPIGHIYAADITGISAGDIEGLRTQAAQGDKEAQYKLGIAYDLGHGVGQDFPEAAKWMQKSATQGVPRAQILFGLMCAKGEGVPIDKENAYMWMSFAANQGNHDGQTMLGMYSKLLNASEIAVAQKRADEWKFDTH